MMNRNDVHRLFFKRNMRLRLKVTITFALLIAALAVRSSSQAAPSLQTAQSSITWTHLSTANGDLPLPFDSTEQTSALVLDIDNNGLNDFVISARDAPGPSIVAYLRTSTDWTRYVIEADVLPFAAGGTFEDIDSDGDLDIVMGANPESNEVWWWENPYPNYKAAQDWTRRLIKNSGGGKHHDQIFGDFDGDGDPELVFWNQRGGKLILAEIPDDPRNTSPWPSTPIYEYAAAAEHEGLAKYDIDNDGIEDIVGGGRWFKYDGGQPGAYSAHIIDASQAFSRVAVGQLKAGGYPEVVFVKGDGAGRLNWYEYNGSQWVATDLLGFDVDHGHSLAIDDIDGDGNLDIFAAEMRLNGGNDDAKVWFFYGDGNGGFTTTEEITGYGNHESKLADLDGDGDLDIFGKPYNWETPRLDIWLNDTGSACQQPLDNWKRHVIDPAKPARSVFIIPADLDYDGLDDIVTGGWWYKNPGTPAGTWSRRTIGAPLNNVAAVYDFDGDGISDIIGTEGVGSEANAGFIWARNDGSGDFTIHNNTEAADGDFLQGVAVDEFEPGKTGVALSWHRSNLGVQSLTVPADAVNASWQWGELSAITQDEALSSGDIDRDGNPDLLLGTKWLRNVPGSTEWVAYDLFQGGGSPDRNHLVDMNRDGRLDAVVGYESGAPSGSLAWYEQPPVATDLWTEHVIANITKPMSLDVADLDGDGDQDVVAGEHDQSDGGSQARILIFENPGSPGEPWVEHHIYTGDEHHDGAQLVDVDNDGDLDVISIGWSHERVLLYENQTCARSILRDRSFLPALMQGHEN